jgi:hypothetical protein
MLTFGDLFEYKEEGKGDVGGNERHNAMKTK